MTNEQGFKCRSSDGALLESQSLLCLGLVSWPQKTQLCFPSDFSVCNRDQDIFGAVPDRCSEDWLVNAARMFWKYGSFFFFKVFCGHRLSVNKGSLEHCQLFKYSKPRKAAMRRWMPEEPDVRLVPPERACCKQIHNGFGASKSINRLSNDRLEQQISCVWGSTEPISC